MLRVWSLLIDKARTRRSWLLNLLLLEDLSVNLVHWTVLLRKVFGMSFYYFAVHHWFRIWMLHMLNLLDLLRRMVDLSYLAVAIWHTTLSRMLGQLGRGCLLLVHELLAVSNLLLHGSFFCKSIKKLKALTLLLLNLQYVFLFYFESIIGHLFLLSQMLLINVHLLLHWLLLLIHILFKL